jgi:hypothetical protein
VHVLMAEPAAGGRPGKLASTRVFHALPSKRLLVTPSLRCTAGAHNPNHCARRTVFVCIQHHHSFSAAKREPRLCGWIGNYHFCIASNILEQCDFEQLRFPRSSRRRELGGDQILKRNYDGDSFVLERGVCAHSRSQRNLVRQNCVRLQFRGHEPVIRPIRSSICKDRSQWHSSVRLQAHAAVERGSERSRERHRLRHGCDPAVAGCKGGAEHVRGFDGEHNHRHSRDQRGAL